jgi:hypothetical protein
MLGLCRSPADYQMSGRDWRLARERLAPDFGKCLLKKLPSSCCAATLRDDQRELSSNQPGGTRCASASQYSMAAVGNRRESMASWPVGIV